MAPFEALYGRRCRSPIGLFDAFEVRPWVTDLLRESSEKVKVIQEKLLVAHSKQKEYADRKVWDLEFMVREQVLLKVSPVKCAIRSYSSDTVTSSLVAEVKEHQYEDPSLIQYRETTPQKKKSPFEISRDGVLRDVPVHDVQVIEQLSYEEVPVAILDRQVHRLRTKDVASIKVLWRNKNADEMTWDDKEDMKSKYPHLFFIPEKVGSNAITEKTLLKYFRLLKV
ncbi:uncharacterized protein LOC132612986 [Lycium barbarum]|uniref:uncharacterized protein LOC132612986 n=1 Tax=Lycium barbarum TaxID=112863 RepID=UPI00293F2E64|nr:uncharacterized protein LOC132612986 [Lycium barbarum]